eukprot:4991273-Pyramimonas_sp.AAC.1
MQVRRCQGRRFRQALRFHNGIWSCVLMQHRAHFFQSCKRAASGPVAGPCDAGLRSVRSCFPLSFKTRSTSQSTYAWTTSSRPRRAPRWKCSRPAGIPARTWAWGRGEDALQGDRGATYTTPIPT